MYLLETMDLGYPADIILVQRREQLYQADSLVKRPQELDYTANILNKGMMEHGYGVNIVLRQSHVDDMMRDLEINTPQYWDITAPLLCRKETGRFRREW